MLIFQGVTLFFLSVLNWSHKNSGDSVVLEFGKDQNAELLGPISYGFEDVDAGLLT